MCGFKFVLVCFFVLVFMLSSVCVVVMSLGSMVLFFLILCARMCFCLCVIMVMFDMIFLLLSKYVNES